MIRDASSAINCFHCGKRFAGDLPEAIYRTGTAPDGKPSRIWLHLECAEELINALNKDVQAIWLAGMDGSTMAGKALDF